MTKTKNLNGSRKHPAPYSKSILKVIDDVLPSGADVLDPMAGDGRALDTLGGGRAFFGIDLEVWKDRASWVKQGNAINLPFVDKRFMYAVCSPTYANRMADCHNAKEKCRKCSGTGVFDSKDPLEDPETCPRCKGLGRNEYSRITYFHRLGKALHRDNTAQLGWTGKQGLRYRELHELIWDELARVLDDNAIFIFNVSDHVRSPKKGVQETMPVTDWHISYLMNHFDIVKDGHVKVETRRMKYGANRDARADHESVFILRRKVRS